MKKLILTCLFVLLYSTSLVSALDSVWFKNNPQVQTLYVDSPEGLRIRNEPTLKSPIPGAKARLPLHPSVTETVAPSRAVAAPTTKRCDSAGLYWSLPSCMLPTNVPVNT